MIETDLSSFSNNGYRPGSAFKKVSWYLVSLFFFRTSFPWPSRIKVLLLRLYGAEIGIGVVVKPSVAIKYPWFLAVGDHSWIGEMVWIDNLASVSIGSNVCISQGAMLLTGNHNYKKSSFDLMVRPIILESGVWLGAKSAVCPGITCLSHSVLSVGGVATADLKSYSVYSGNPAKEIKSREIT
ncbi:MAG: putative colanic acid biosynthesis acetyltransferase WcaF [Cryomorphaceae bacterium]|jgi:putative colanic acid biosynthesis acetyltransferase WcaF